NRDYTLHIVDLDKTEAHQREIFGDFYNNRLPHITDEKRYPLAMLGRIIDADPKEPEEPNRTLPQIVQDDINNTARHTVALVGRSGVGKTATVVNLAQHHFVVYIVCSDPNIKEELVDINFQSLGHKIRKLPARVRHLQPWRDRINQMQNLA